MKTARPRILSYIPETFCVGSVGQYINGAVSLGKAILLLLVNRGQAAPHPSQQRKLKQTVGL